MRESHQVSAASAAHELGISRERVVRLVQRHVLIGRIEGGRWLVDSRSLQQYKRESSQGSLNGPGGGLRFGAADLSQMIHEPVGSRSLGRRGSRRQ